MITDFNVNFTEKEISPIYQKIKDYPWNSIPDLEGWEHGTNKTYLKELVWREFFQQILYHFPMRNLFLFLSIIFFPSFSFGDLIKINDGSIVSGKITKFDKDTISLKTEFAGTIKIERDKVLSVDSKEDFSIKLKGGKKALGSLTLSLIHI